MDDIEALRRAYVSEVTGQRRAQRGGDRVTARRVRETVSAELTEESLDQMLVDADSFETAARLSLDVLGDEAAAPVVRMAALRRLGGAAFQPVRFAAFHAEYVERLREVAVSDNKDLRMTALDQLTLMDDEVGQHLVRESLDGTRKPLVPAASAVRMLARDEHGSAAPLLRDLARTGAPRVREQAIRALATDPDSVELLASISTDKSERTALRELAAMSLRASAPARFANVARELVLDDDESDRLRTTALSAITVTPEATEALDLPEFSAELGRVGTTKSTSLRQSINRFEQSTSSDAQT